MKVIVDGFILRDGKVLLGRRPMEKRFLPGYWELIGGHVEHGESPQEALRREIREELGVDPVLGEPFHAFGYPALDNEWGVCVVFFASIDGEPKMHAHDELRWVTEAESRKLHLMPEERETIRKGFEATDD